MRRNFQNHVPYNTCEWLLLGLFPANIFWSPIGLEEVLRANYMRETVSLLACLSNPKTSQV